MTLVSAGAFGFLTLIQCGERPDRYGLSRRLATMPSSPSCRRTQTERHRRAEHVSIKPGGRRAGGGAERHNMGLTTPTQARGRAVAWAAIAPDRGRLNLFGPHTQLAQYA